MIGSESHISDHNLEYVSRWLPESVWNRVRNVDNVTAKKLVWDGANIVFDGNKPILIIFVTRWVSDDRISIVLISSSDGSISGYSPEVGLEAEDKTSCSTLKQRRDWKLWGDRSSGTSSRPRAFATFVGTERMLRTRSAQVLALPYAGNAEDCANTTA